MPMLPYDDNSFPSLSSNQTPFGNDVVGLPGGASSPGVAGGSGSSLDFGGLAKTISPLILSLFGSNPAKGKAAATTDTLAAQGKDLFGTNKTAMGDSALAPVLSYLKAIASGNPADVLSAVAPDRARIMDQYDTGRKAISTFTPRGGGNAAAINESFTKESSDLGTTTAAARSKGISDLSNLGLNLESLGASEKSTGVGATSSAQQAYLAEADQNNKDNAQLGSAIGAALPFILAGFGI